MFENLDNKQRATYTFIALAIASILFWYFSDVFSAWIAQTNPLLAVFVTIIINPVYIFLIFWLYSQYQFRGVIAGILISAGVDIISLGHSITKAGIMPNSLDSVPLYTYPDTVLYKSFLTILSPGPILAFVLYVVIPVLFFYLALRIVRRTASFNRIFKEAM